MAVGKTKIIVRSCFDASTDPGVDCSGDVVLVDQSFKSECDINHIMAKYTRTGELPPSAAKAVYGDFSGITSYQDALKAVMNAQEAFNALEARVRSRFENDPAKLIQALEDPSRRDELVEIGVLTAKDTEEVSVPSKKAPKASSMGKGGQNVPSGEAATQGAT